MPIGHKKEVKKYNKPWSINIQEKNHKLLHFMLDLHFK
jgi:hypothetical protein